MSKKKDQVEITTNLSCGVTEGYVHINTRLACIVTSNNLRSNGKTEEVLKRIERSYVNDDLPEDLVEALTVGPMNELEKRLDVLFLKHFGKKFQSKALGNRV